MPTTGSPERPYAVRRSLSGGLGLFSTRAIPRGQIIIEYIGPLLTNAQADEKGGRYLFCVNSRWTIDGSARSNTARYANHSCRPNCEAVITGKRVFLKAIKTIPPDTEICHNYGREYFDAFIKPNGCRCRACRMQKESPTGNIPGGHSETTS